jgi:arylsulfatase A-like enzyme
MHWLRGLSWGALLGLAAATAAAGWESHAEGHLTLLPRLTLATWTRFAWPALGAGSALGLAAAAALHWMRSRRAASTPAARGGLAPAIAAAAGVLVLAGATLALRIPPLAARAAEHPNVLLIVLDTVRADRLSCYGYEKPTTPELDAFAREATRFTEFYSTSSWTIPSHSSLFTGLFPVSHGATQEKMILDRSFVTLAETFADAGYRTWAASGNPYASSAAGLGQGFHEFVETWSVDPRLSEREEPYLPHAANEAFEGFLERNGPERPFFAFINYMEAHFPFRPPQPHLSRFLPRGTSLSKALRLGALHQTEFYAGQKLTAEELRIVSGLYDGELAFLSRVVGDLLEALRRDGRFENTLIVITSDHGEHFGENDLYGHMFGLYNTSVHVPLLVRRPGGEGRGRTDPRPAQVLDLFPTILAEAGVDAPTGHQGIDLSAGEGRRAILSEYYYPSQVFNLFAERKLSQNAELARYKRRLRALQRDGRRLIWSSNGQHELYDLRSDPGETHDLYDPEQPERAADLAAALQAELDRIAPGVELEGTPLPAQGGAPVVDEAAQKALRALGYVK